MKNQFLTLSIASLIFWQCTTQPDSPPLATVQNVTDNYFGVELNDPYRYMENLEDSTVLNWMKLQADYAREMINNIPGRQELLDQMIEFDSRRAEVVYNLSITDDDRYFYLKRTPDEEVGKLYFRDGFEGEESLLFDPENVDFDTSQTYVISSVSPSFDGKKVAFEIAPNGSESSILLIMNVEDKTLFPEKIDRCWQSGASWLSDNETFFFLRMNSDDVHDTERLLNTKVYLHKVGTEPEEDVEFFSSSTYPELKILPKEIPFVAYDRDNNHLYAFLFTVDNRLDVRYAPVEEMKKDKVNWKRLFKKEDDIRNFATTEKEIFALSSKDASNLKILKMTISNPDLATAEVFVPENPDAKIGSFDLTSDGLYYTLTLNGVQEKLYFVQKGSTKSEEIELPFTAGEIGLDSKGPRFDFLKVNISGWSSPNKPFRYYRSTNEFKLEQLSTPVEYPEYDNLVVEEVMVPSHDGVEVPLSIIYKEGLEKNGTNRVLFYGYGSYGYSTSPFFSPSFLLWVQEGGILAIAHVRGGGEMGDKWHRGGQKTTKPNTWKDLIACGEYMIKEGYTSSPYTAINGGSAGGIMVGRAMTERPDLFAVAIPEVGSMNCVRAELTPGGPANIPEFGTVEDSVECMALIEMDSYHHLVEGTAYPATLVTSGMNDPRVTAWVPTKFAARLQAANTSDKPMLLFVDYEAGHGIGDTKTKQFESLADVLSFALWQTGHPKYN